MTLRVGSRKSPLALVQVKEIEVLFPEQTFSLHPVKTRGDHDKKSSLRTMGRTNFFTEELDLMLLENECDITIHSAKDLPEPLPEGLEIAAITKGIDPRDALVMPPGKTVKDLQVVGTSSKHREEMVNLLKSTITFKDIRGTIGERLSLMENGFIEGVVIAESALIRLNLTHLNRVYLPGSTTPLQGQLAVLTREDAPAISALFSRIDCRRKKLYLGLRDPLQDDTLHYPIIKIEPIPLPEIDFSPVTHVLYTSQTAVELFPPKPHWTVIALGEKTATKLPQATLIAKEPTAEGVVALLETLNLDKSHILWPHSALARPLINEYLSSHHIPHTTFPLYTTCHQIPFPLPNLSHFEELIFTSPSTVAAFYEQFGAPPPHLILSTIGPVTESNLLQIKEKNPTISL